MVDQRAGHPYKHRVDRITKVGNRRRNWDEQDRGEGWAVVGKKSLRLLCSAWWRLSKTPPYAVQLSAVPTASVLSRRFQFVFVFFFSLKSSLKSEFLRLSSSGMRRFFLGLAKARRIDSHFQCGKRNSALHFLFYQLAHGGCRGSSFFSVGVYWIWPDWCATWGCVGVEPAR